MNAPGGWEVLLLLVLTLPVVLLGGGIWLAVRTVSRRERRRT